MRHRGCGCVLVPGKRTARHLHHGCCPVLSSIEVRAAHSRVQGHAEYRPLVTKEGILPLLPPNSAWEHMLLHHWSRVGYKYILGESTSMCTFGDKPPISAQVNQRHAVPVWREDQALPRDRAPQTESGDHPPPRKERDSMWLKPQHCPLQSNCCTARLIGNSSLGIA